VARRPSRTVERQDLTIKVRGHAELRCRTRNAQQSIIDCSRGGGLVRRPGMAVERHQGAWLSRNKIGADRSTESWPRARDLVSISRGANVSGGRPDVTVVHRCLARGNRNAERLARTRNRIY
jgi:hypothetical protein